MYQKIVYSAIIVLSICSCASTPTSGVKTIYLDQISKETTVYVKVGEVIKIQMETNPTTGYRWKTIQADDCNVEIIDEDVQAIYSDGRVGGPSMQIYQVRANAIGTCTMGFDYYRSWENTVRQPKSVIFIVK